MRKRIALPRPGTISFTPGKRLLGMARKTINDRRRHRSDREFLETMAVRLMVIAEECVDPATQLKLRRLADEFYSSFLSLEEAYAQLNIVQDFIPVGHSNRPGKRIVPTAITIHNTDNAELGADAAAHAHYLKSADARRRKVSWHFTVDDKRAYQSLPINEIGWHTNNKKGNAISIGVQICMNNDLDASAAYRRAALLAAVLTFQNEIKVPKRIFQHYDWSGKNCPRVLRDTTNSWQNFLAQIQDFRDKLVIVPALTITPAQVRDHHLFGR
jgi:hypothetical protein